VRNEVGESPILNRKAEGRRHGTGPKNRTKENKGLHRHARLPAGPDYARLATCVGRIPAQQQSTSEVPAGLLMLVRACEPKTGELIGWMPMHRVALTLQQLAEEKGTPTFDLNQALTVDFPYRPKDAAKYGRLLVMHETASFQGREWMPIQQTPNLVHIHKFTFYVKSIDFVESRWRRSTVVDSVSQMLGK